MTNFQVGQIIEINDTISCVRNRDYWKITTSAGIFHISDNRILNFTKTAFRIIILARINNNIYKAALNYQVKSKKIREQIMGSYYSIKCNRQPKPIKTELEKIIHLLKKTFISENYPDGISLDKVDETINIDRIYDLHFRNIFYLPVFSPIVDTIFTGKPNFYPDPTNTITVYKADNNENYPLKFEGNLINDSTSKKVTIFLHGFLVPYKWHFDIWKHFGKNKAFNACDLNSSDSICNIIGTCLIRQSDSFTYDKFSEAHTKARQLCQDYLNKFVTHFKNNTTKILKITGDDGFLRKFDIEIPLMCSNNVYKIVVFKGISYNFDLQKPTLHINPLTYYRIDEKRYGKKTSETVRDIYTLKDIILETAI